MIRTFHPIGQGAFYSEQFDNFRIVYDCGTTNSKAIADKVVRNSFGHGSTINYLFISHFDNDHVNRIETLIKHYKIDNVVMPYLHGDHKILLTNIYRSLGFTLSAQLIESPEAILGDETRIIYVVAPGDEYGNRDNNGLRSGNPIHNSVDNWVYIPYNIRNVQRTKELEDLLNLYNLDIKKLRNDIDYVKDNIDIVKLIYNKLSGNINENSMILYSGPNGPKSKHYRRSFFNRTLYSHELFPILPQAACIYTGDSDLKATDIKTIYNTHWSYVGTIQIPHHGSAHSFSNAPFDGKEYHCPISFGTSNSYGHPSQIVNSELILANCFPFYVTENMDSVYIELIV